MGEPLLLDTAPLRDQRTMVDVMAPNFAHKTPEEIEAAWQGWVDREGLPIRRRRGDYSRELRESRKVVVAYVSGGTWIADCPSCNGGVAAWPYHERGCCLDCGTIYRISYPPQDQIEAAVKILSERDEHHRHWHVHLGETVDHLEVENRHLRQAKILQGAVGIDAVRDVLGDDAIEKLQAAGVV